MNTILLTLAILGTHNVSIIETWDREDGAFSNSIYYAQKGTETVNDGKSVTWSIRPMDAYLANEELQDANLSWQISRLNRKISKE